MSDGRPEVASVVQRYGEGITGGSESLARAVAERLAAELRITVFTTCARDYVTWRNELPAGESEVNGVRVRRFPVRRERDPERFGRRSHHVFGSRHSIADELAWLDSEGPGSRALIDSVPATTRATTSSSFSASATTTRKRLQAALDDLDAHVVAVPPFEARFLRRGHRALPL